MTTTNDIRHTINATGPNGEQVEIKIRLNDECRNGHEDFSMTGTVWEKGKPRNDRNLITAGCCHDAILAARPDLKIFVDLHLCDADGVPMYAIANGMYHMENELSNHQPGTEGHKQRFCEYYRITPAQFDELKEASNKVQYFRTLERLDIFTQWKRDADEAIKLLEEMTGKTFKSTATNSNHKGNPTPEEIQEEDTRQASGYYTPAAIEAREEAARLKQFTDLEEERAQKIQEIDFEHTVKRAILTAGGARALKNHIYYNHTKTVVFNWMTYHGSDKLTEQEIEAIKANIILPEGVTIGKK